MADDKRPVDEQNEDLANRRDFLLSMKKWSKIIIGGLLVAGAVATSTKTTHARGSWINRRGGGGGWTNRGGGGGWYNRGGGGGAWINGGGGGWYNRGGSWINGGSGGWINRRGGGGGSWINRR